MERHLSALAEETCDDVVDASATSVRFELARGHGPSEYSDYLVDMARSVKRAGSRLNVAGMAMPGSSLPRRIPQILEGGSAPHTSRTRMACAGVACAIAVLREYPAARSGGQFGKEHELWTVFANLERALHETKPVQALPTLRIKWSVGQGNWAKVPWNVDVG